MNHRDFFDLFFRPPLPRCLAVPATTAFAWRIAEPSEAPLLRALSATCAHIRFFFAVFARLVCRRASFELQGIVSPQNKKGATPTGVAPRFQASFCRPFGYAVLIIRIPAQKKSRGKLRCLLAFGFCASTHPADSLFLRPFYYPWASLIHGYFDRARFLLEA